MNLVLNAVDALDGTTLPSVSVRTKDLGKCVRLEVEDTGPGVSAEIRQRLFEPFVTTKGAGKGTGLGLFLARKLVEQSGGKLELETPPFVGARFAVELPKAA
jgi:signal transduction histidine kinase